MLDFIKTNSFELIMFVLEIMYYTMFIKYTKNDKNIIKYILLFFVISCLVMTLGNTNLFTYSAIWAITLLAMKYPLQIKTRICNIIILTEMIIYKFLIEEILVLALSSLINVAYIVLAAGIIKIGSVFLFRRELNKLYKRLLLFWDMNNIYIRWGSAIVIILYVLISICYLILI